MNAKRIESLIRPHLARIGTYGAITPTDILAKQAGIPESQIIKLDGNENPYGTSPRVAQAVAKADYRFYPDPLQRRTRKALGEFTGFESDQIIAGAGSDEMIDLLFRLVLDPGDNVIICEPTFGMYRFCADVHDARITAVELDHMFNIDPVVIKMLLTKGPKSSLSARPTTRLGTSLLQTT